MAYLKPQSPIKFQEDHIYPLTTVDQIIMEDGQRLSGVGVYLDRPEDGEDTTVYGNNADTFSGHTVESFKVLMLNLAHPVGSYYWSKEATDPSTLFGGTWEQIKDQFILAAGNNYSVGSTGGNANVTLTTANMPAHSHTRGTMNITGTFRLTGDASNAGIDAPASGSGAITPINGTGSGCKVDATDWNCGLGFDFDASKNWTGQTSSVGSGQAFNNMPPYRVAYCWCRIA